MKGIMRAAVFKEAGRMAVEELPIPECGEDGLLVKVHACGICGSDIRNFQSGLKDGIKNQIMGHEIAGEVVEAGRNVKRFRPGDRVALAPDVSCGQCWYCRRGLINLCENHRMLGTHFPGGYAQYLAVPPEVLSHGFAEPIPEGMDYDQAAFAETCAAVLACQERINVRMGQTIVIIGDGPVGCIHCETARARGAAQVILVGRGKLKLAARFEPDVMLRGDRPEEELIEEVRERTGGLGADAVICAAPAVEIQREALAMVRKRGIVVIYGGAPKGSHMTSLDSNLIHYGEITVTGAFSYPKTGLRDALAALEAGQIHGERYLNGRVGLDGIVEGMEMVKHAQALKVIVAPWEERYSGAGIVRQEGE